MGILLYKDTVGEKLSKEVVVEEYYQTRVKLIDVESDCTKTLV